MANSFSLLHLQTDLKFRDVRNPEGIPKTGPKDVSEGRQYQKYLHRGAEAALIRLS
jgi:hypothetical protein